MVRCPQRHAVGRSADRVSWTGRLVLCVGLCVVYATPAPADRSSAAPSDGHVHDVGAAQAAQPLPGTPGSAVRPSSPWSPRFVSQVGADFKTLFTTPENLLILGVGGVAAIAAHPWDEDIAFGRFNSELHGNTTLDGTFEAGQILGGGAVLIGSAFAVYGAGRAFDKPGVATFGRDLVRAQVVTQAVTFALKLSVGRGRPEDPSNTLSFPSGHASGSFAAATVVQRHYGWKAGVPSYAFAAYVAASRLNEARHYLSDVTFGAAVGIMGGYTVTLDLDDSRWGVAPWLHQDAMGIRVAWLGNNPESASQ